MFSIKIPNEHIKKDFRNIKRINTDKFLSLLEFGAAFDRAQCVR